MFIDKRLMVVIFLYKKNIFHKEDGLFKNSRRNRNRHKIITSRLDQNKKMLLKNIFDLGILKSSYQITKIKIIRSISSKRLTVQEETIINKKVFYSRAQEGVRS